MYATGSPCTFSASCGGRASSIRLSENPLVAGKAEAVPVDAKLLAGGELGPCPICEPVEETD